MLLLAAIIWGTGFVFQKIGMNYIGPFTFGALRFLLGAVSLIPVMIIFDNQSKKKAGIQVKGKLNLKTKEMMIGGFFCGLALFLGASFQQIGIIGTSAGKTGFITALYIVIVPLFGIFMNKKVSFPTWLGIGIAIIGLYLLTIKQGFSVQPYDGIVLIGTIFWALQIVLIDIYVEKVDILRLSFVQFLTAGMFSAVAALALEKPELSSIIACSAVVLYMGVMDTGVAFTLQSIGQKYTRPAVAGIILSLESVFAVISGAIFLGESMSTRELSGCLLVFAAVIITQINPKEILGLFGKPSLD
ncbi:MAG: DMT family transporter [Eubacteriales bacterium]